MSTSSLRLSTLGPVSALDSLFCFSASFPAAPISGPLCQLLAGFCPAELALRSKSLSYPHLSFCQHLDASEALQLFSRYPIFCLLFPRGFGSTFQGWPSRTWMHSPLCITGQATHLGEKASNTLHPLASWASVPNQHHSGEPGKRKNVLT